jgi:acyl dehydratase
MDMQPGAVATLHRTFEQRDFDRFAALSGDDNPIHVDPDFCSRTRFGRPVAHGMLLYSTICRALTEEVGAGFRQVEQELVFLTPTYTGEPVEVRLEVTGLPATGLAEIATMATRPDGSVGCQGRTVVVLPPAGTSFDSVAPPTGCQRAQDAAGGVGEQSYKSLRIGQAAECVRTVSLADLVEYRDLSGDLNPAFSDPAYAAANGWPSPLVPGGLLGGLFSFLLGTRLPGRGTNWLKQRLVYPAPCFAGEEVTASVEIVRLRPEKDLVNLRGTCCAGGRVVCEGESLVLVKDLENA